MAAMNACKGQANTGESAAPSPLVKLPATCSQVGSNSMILGPMLVADHNANPEQK
jgi:hypothetical protein